MEIPFNLLQSPDTVIVEFQTSLWNDTLVSYVGSTLILDEVRFKSNPLPSGFLNLGPQDLVSVFPNPTNGLFTLYSEMKNSLLEIYNEIGEKIYFRQIETGKIWIDISNQPRGIYFYKLKSENGACKSGKIILD